MSSSVPAKGGHSAPPKRKRHSSGLRKAPQAPKRFKSSYICFFVAKQDEIKKELGGAANVSSVSKRSAAKWRNLTAEERLHWDEVAAKDKQRYLAEKAMYTGPWQVPQKRARKDPSAPKRPMSAFLYFSQSRRQEIKEKNPEMRNTEISQELGKMWRESPEEERAPHVGREKIERQKYKVEMAKWKKEQEEKEAELKKQQEEQAKEFQRQAAEAAAANPPAQAYGYSWPPYPYYPYPASAQGDGENPSGSAAVQYPGYSYPYPPANANSSGGEGAGTAPSKAPIPQVLGPTGMPQGYPVYHYPFPPQAYPAPSNQHPQAAPHHQGAFDPNMSYPNTADGASGITKGEEEGA
jgi:hypothetical protein